MKHLVQPILIGLLFIAGCKPQAAVSNSSELTAKEKFYCDSLKIDTSVVTGIRQYSVAPVEPFHYSLGKEYDKDGREKETDPVHLQGLVFNAPNRAASGIVMNLRNTFREKGYSIFLLENNFGIKDKPDVIGVLKTTDKYAVLKQIKTNGINYNIDPDSLISIIKIFDQKYSLDLVGASGDWCEFIIRKEPADWLALAKEAYKVCPDIVDQGTNTVEALAEEMKRTKHLYFWWD